MRTIYSIDEATELTQLSTVNLIGLGCSGDLRFLIDVPGDIQVGNVGWSDTEEVVDPVIRALNRRAFHLTPIPVHQLDLLALSKEDCQKLQARGKIRQAVFFEAATFDLESQLMVIRPSQPEDEPSGLGKLHFPKRVFAAYDRNILFQESRRNVVVPTKELVITASQLRITATELLPYLISQEQRPSAQPLVVSKPNAAVVGNKKKRGSSNYVGVMVKEIYRHATKEEKEDTQILWEKMKEFAQQKRPPLLYAMNKEIYYENPDGETVDILTRKMFVERIRYLEKKEAKDVSSPTNSNDRINT